MNHRSEWEKMELPELDVLGSKIALRPFIGDQINGYIVHLATRKEVILRDMDNFKCRYPMTRINFLVFCTKSGEYFKRGEQEERREVRNESAVQSADDLFSGRG
jgi:hypothetical protein